MTEHRSERPRGYLAYLLRLWSVPGAGGAGRWRASLENAQTGERRTFASLEELVAYLSIQVGAGIGSKEVKE